MIAEPSRNIANKINVLVSIAQFVFSYWHQSQAIRQSRFGTAYKIQHC